MTFEVPERVDAAGQSRAAARRGAVRAIIERLGNARSRQSASVSCGRCWRRRTSCAWASFRTSISPAVPYTLSHQLNPTIREYRRASSTCIDASLKPLMSRYLAGLQRALGRRPGLTAAPDRQLARQRGRCRLPCGPSHPFREVRPGGGAGCRSPLCQGRERQRRGDRRRHRRHQLRCDAGDRAVISLHARDLAG